MPKKNQPGCPCCGSGTCCQVACSPCNLPQKDLLLTYTNVITGNGTVTLSYSGTSWSSACSNGLMYVLQCTGGQLELRVIYFTSGSCPTGTQQYCSNLRTAPFGLQLTNSVCSPLSLTYQATGLSCPALLESGYVQWVISDPDPAPNPPGLMCQSFRIFGCSQHGYPGLTVTVSSGGAPVASGVTNASGVVFLSWPGAPGTYSWTVAGASSRFIPFAGATANFLCGGSQSATLTAAEGFTCSSCCLIPLANTLTAFFVRGGESVNIVWNPVGFPGVDGPGWYDPTRPVGEGVVGMPQDQCVFLTGTSTATLLSADCPPSLDLVFSDGFTEVEVTE